MNNKKGISAVVATVLIILITVAAVTIVWQAIIPMIQNQLEEGTICLDASSTLVIENKEFTCFDDTANVVKVQISHGAKDIGLVDIQILVSDDAGSTSSHLSSATDVTGTDPTANGMSVLTVTGYSGIATAVAVSPVVLIGGKEKACDASVPVVLAPCS